MKLTAIRENSLPKALGAMWCPLWPSAPILSSMRSRVLSTLLITASLGPITAWHLIGTQDKFVDSINKYTAFMEHVWTGCLTSLGANLILTKKSHQTAHSGGKSLCSERDRHHSRKCQECSFVLISSSEKIVGILHVRQLMNLVLLTNTFIFQPQQIMKSCQLSYQVEQCFHH